MPKSMQASPLRTGIGFRPSHFAAMIEFRPAVGFLEVHAENAMGGGRAMAQLERLRRDWPISVHGVGLSLGSVERPEPTHLERLAALVERIEPLLVSEHLAFSRVGDHYLNDLLPLPMTPEALDMFARNVDIVQERIGRRILVENPSRYLSFRGSTMSEPEFLNELAVRTGCGVVLDLNNVYVTCANVGGDALAWCKALDRRVIEEIHLAGHSHLHTPGRSLLIDDHGSAVSREVWNLFESVIRSAPAAPVLVEWDSRIPPLGRLVGEARKADARRERSLTPRQSTPQRRWIHAHTC